MAKARDRQDDRVQAGDDRHPGDLRVAHDLGDRQGGEGRAGDDVDRQPSGSIGRMPSRIGSRRLALAARVPAGAVMGGTPPPPRPRRCRERTRQYSGSAQALRITRLA